MAEGLSSNWKKLQAKIKAESTTATNPPTKRKQTDACREEEHLKRHKTSKAQPRQPASVSSKPTAGRAVAQEKPMGVPQSSVVSSGTASTVKPSLSLWAADNNISPEDLAEAYGLGTKQNALLTSEPPRPNEGRAPDADKLGKYVALDCEMVGVGPDGHDSALARVSLVDFHGRQVYDAYVRPRERVVDWRTRYSGVTPRHMAGARDFATAQREVAELIAGRVLVGHDLRHDLAALMLTHPTSYMRDTARFSGFRKYGHGPKPALRTLAKELLGMEIQTGAHSSIEDAKAAMLLFRKRKSEFDMENANKFDKPRGSGPKTSSAASAKKKKRR